MQVMQRQTIVERRQPFARWSAIFAGTVVSVAFWVLFQVLGLGIGLASVDVDDAGTLVRASIGTSAWSLIAPVLALFLGGLVAGRLSGTFDRGSRAVHGMVVWALTLSLGIVTTLGIVSAIAGFAFTRPYSEKASYIAVRASAYPACHAGGGLLTAVWNSSARAAFSASFAPFMGTMPPGSWTTTAPSSAKP